MNSIKTFGAIVPLALFLGCSNPADKLADSGAEFASLDPAAQNKTTKSP